MDVLEVIDQNVEVYYVSTGTVPYGTEYKCIK